MKTAQETTAVLTQEQEGELRRIKRMLPYRIAYAAVNPSTGEFVASAVFNMRVPNNYARKGWLVFTL